MKIHLLQILRSENTSGDSMFLAGLINVNPAKETCAFSCTIIFHEIAFVLFMKIGEGYILTAVNTY